MFIRGNAPKVFLLDDEKIFIPRSKPALSRCNPQKNPLPSADYVASGRRTLQGRFSDEKRLC